MKVPVIAIAGDALPGAELIFERVYTLTERVRSAELAINHAEHLVFVVAKEITVQLLEEL
jgi:glycerate kinase